MLLEDAQKHLENAKDFLKREKENGVKNSAAILLEMQKCLEDAIKVLLDQLDIPYFEKEKPSGKIRIYHDVSEKIPEAFSQIKNLLLRNNGEGKVYGVNKFVIEDYRKSLAKTTILLKLLTSIRNWIDHGVEAFNFNEKRKIQLATSTEIFNTSYPYPEFKELAEILINMGEKCYEWINEIISKIEELKGK